MATGSPQMVVAATDQWSITSAPAAGSKATVTHPASTGQQVCSYIIASVVSGGVGGASTLNLRDGATGAGNVLLSWAAGVGAQAGMTNTIAVGPLGLPGTSGNAMTLEFAAAPAAGNLQSVTLVGYSR